MRYTHSAVGLKRLSLPLACWELGFVLRDRSAPGVLASSRGPRGRAACAVSVSVSYQSYAVGAQRGRGRGAGRGAATRNQETLRIACDGMRRAKLPAVR